MATTNALWESLEQSSPTTFLIGGGLLLGYAVSKGIYVFTDLSPIGAFDVAYGTLGLLVVGLGLLGLYPRLRDHAPRLSLAGVVASAIAAACSIALLIWLASATLLSGGYPAIPEDAPVWTVAALFVVFVTLALGCLLFGAASLRTEVPSTTVGRLLVVPGCVWIGLLVANVIAPSGQYLGLLAYVPISLALLAIGYLLRTGAIQPDHVGSAPDSIA